MDSQRGEEVTRPPEKVQLLRRRVDSERADLALLVGELNRRRREAADVKLQLRRHPIAAAALALGAAGLVAVGTIAAVRAARARRRAGSLTARIAAAARALPSAGRAPAPRRSRAAAGLLAIGSRFAWALVPAMATLVARRAAASLGRSSA